MENKKVSACIIAYNHEKYIKECLDGALAQKVNFSYEIVISEDCSTDNTREIVTAYRDKYPGKIKLHLNKENLGLTGNWVASLRRCQGEYIAICEGDDYWTNPNKLQKQIDFLDKNQEYALSMHNANIFYGDEIIGKYRPPSNPEVMDLKHLLTYGSGGPTCSLVIRNSAIQNLPEWFSRMKACDWTVQVIAAQHGKMKYFPEVMAVYRKHKKGANYSAKKEAQSQGKSDFALPAKNTLEMINVINKYFNYKYKKELDFQSVYWFNWYVREYMSIDDYKNAKKHSQKIIFTLFPFRIFKYKLLNNIELLKVLIIGCLPCFLIKLLKQLNEKQK